MHYVKDKGQERILEIYLQQKIIKMLVLCLAAPGTGKTTTIVRLLMALLDLGTKSPIKNFLVLTFTKRTRNDILRKFEDEGRTDLIPKLERVVRNFHSLAFTSLFWENVITDTKSKNQIYEIGQSAGLDVHGNDRGRIHNIIKTIKEAISQNKIQETIDHYMQNDAEFGNIMKSYIDWIQDSYRESKSISYDYALIKFIERIKQGRNPLRIDLNKIQLLIVDQFQDSNPAQMKIVECILERNPKMRLLLMGDIDQTIYTWRGTDLIDINNFMKKYKDDGQFQQVQLENTHRLGSQVLKTSQKLINSRENYRKFRSENFGDYAAKPLNIKNDHAPEVISFSSQYSEVNWVIHKIKELVNAKIGINYRDITVLLRSFKFTRFFNKFKYENTRLAKLHNQTEIPFTVKGDQNHQNMQNILAWFAYFYKKKYFPKDSLKDQIKTIINHVKPSPKTLSNMIEWNIISKNRVQTKRLKSEKAHQWDLFFADFQAIQKLMKQKQSFTDIFQSVYVILSSKGRCEELSENQIKQFLDYVTVLHAHLDKEKLKEEPIFTIMEQIIRNNIYETKTDRMKKRNYKPKQPKKDINKGVQKLTNFYKPKQKTKESNEANQMKEETQYIEQFAYERKEEEEIHYANEADSVQFQTVYKAKGLQYKVVFMCSLNYDYMHDQFEPAAVPRRQGYRNDAQRQYQRAMDFQRYVVREEEELRVIYTGLTRTSKYSFITASKGDCYIPDSCIKHPHFEHLFQQSAKSQHVPFTAQEDRQFKEDYEKHLSNSKKNQKESKTSKLKSYDIRQMFERRKK